MEQNKAFYLFDQTKIYILNNSDKLDIMTQELCTKYFKTHSIILLQYFDRQQQQIQNIQFLWLDPSTTISRFENYITSQLYSIITKLYPHFSSEWCQKLLYQINKMKQFGSSTEHVINIYFSTKDSYSKKYTPYKPTNITQLLPDVDEFFHPEYQTKYQVFEENGCIYDAMLNQTNIASNNNQYYKLQVVKCTITSEYFAYFRWGRVGYRGQSLTKTGTKQQCIDLFMQKFKHQTFNSWSDRNNFIPFQHKYNYLPHFSTSKYTDFQVITFEITIVIHFLTMRYYHQTLQE